MENKLYNRNMSIAALVSGGVDSSVVVHLLCEQGIKPDIFYIRIGMEDEEGYIDCPAEEDIEITQFIAKRYGCRFEEVNLHREYWDNVVAYTIDSVRRGLTPNPDVMCNKLIKFGAFEQRRGHEYDWTATGHYATTERLEGVPFLATAKDPVKDQTDFLSQLDSKQIAKLMFPIGGMMQGLAGYLFPRQDKLQRLPAPLPRRARRQDSGAGDWTCVGHPPGLLVPHHRPAQRPLPEWRTLVCGEEGYRRECALCLPGLRP